MFVMCKYGSHWRLVQTVGANSLIIQIVFSCEQTGLHEFIWQLSQCRSVSVTEAHICWNTTRDSPIMSLSKHCRSVKVSLKHATFKFHLRTHDKTHLRSRDNLCPSVPRNVGVCIYVYVCSHGNNFFILNVCDRRLYKRMLNMQKGKVVPLLVSLSSTS